MDAESFYDAFAEDYHRILADWDATIAGQARIVTALLREHGVAPGARVLDPTCGIGTQALGLAGAGFEVTATDVSAAASSGAVRTDGP